jgi:deoxycytidine triphosphate deaminase
MTISNYNDLSPATSDEEAEKRYNQYKSLDPLPKVDPALLNSGDAYDYICHAGIIYPFTDEETRKKKFKTASYEIDLLGSALFIDEKGAYHELKLENGKKFVFPKNSIVYIIPEVMFRLPDYIALRFNLKITHVHAGLLLGTGPLVDPGYKGQLMVPVHNLTSEDYHVIGGVGFIWVEFTKLSRHKQWDKSGGRDGAPAYFSFEDSKKNRKFDPKTCLDKATGGRPAVSSIPKTLEDASSVLKSFEKLKKELIVGGSLGLIFSGISIIVGILLPTWQLIQDTNSRIDSKSIRTNHNQKDRITKLEKEIDRLRSNIHIINEDVLCIKNPECRSLHLSPLISPLITPLNYADYEAILGN